MATDQRSAPDDDALPEAQVTRRRGPSIVWLIPLIAGAIALWLGYTTLSQRGPTITISFQSAEGLEAGKTRVKHKDVEVGVVEEVAISDDLSQIMVTAEMVKNIQSHVNEGTRFWVVRPRVGAGGVSGLGTLLSGAYIELDPGGGAPATTFVGLEEPPPIRSDVPGRQFLLETDRIGSIVRGAPVSYHGIPVGQVLAYELSPDRQGLTVSIFVNAPHDELVRDHSRFWDASGIDVSLDAAGVNVSGTLQSLLVGGIAFDTPRTGRTDEPSAAGATFPLYDSYRSASEAAYTERHPLLVYFDGSVRGLRVGAPVEFHGIQLGRVTEVRLEFDADRQVLRVPVIIEIEPQRVTLVGERAGKGGYEVVERLVERGLRAQLKPGNLLTGELVLALDFHPESPPEQMRYGGPHPEIPSVPSDFEAITASLGALLDQIASLPLGELVGDVRETVQSINTLAASNEAGQTLEGLSEASAGLTELIATLNRQAGPLIAQMNATLASADGIVGGSSQARYDLTLLLKELSSAARSIRVFADYLERHPEALLRGKASFQ